MTDLHTLLHDAVSDVEPELGLAEIQARTSAPTRSRWLPLLAAAAAVAVAAAGAGAWLAHEGTTEAPPATHGKPHPGKAVGLPTTQPSDVGPSRPVTVPVYYVGSTPAGPRLFREFYRLDSADPVGLTAAARLAVRGAASDPDYASRWPASTRIRSVRIGEGSGLFEVRFGGAAPASRPAGMSAAEARMSLQQLAYTVQGTAQDTAPLVFFSGDRQLHRVLGVRIPSVLERAAGDAVLAPVSITDPAEGATVGNTFTVHGQAATFEANVQWELLRAGKVVDNGHTTATECCTLSPYSFTVHAAHGTYTLVVHAEDASGEGRPVPQDTKVITVR